MLLSPTSTAAATRAFSVTFYACLEASAPLHYVVQKSFATDRMAMTRALCTEMSNETTLHQRA